MQVNIIMQKENENTIANAISSCLEKNAKKAYFFIGNFKETGYKLIEEDFIDIKTKLFFAIGIDKKTTTRNMLEGLLDYTDEVYYYSNNNLNEYVSNIQVYEYSDSAKVLVCTSNLSESGIQTDLSLYTEIVYDLKNTEEKKAYKNQIKQLLAIVEEDGFKKLTMDEITKLIDEKEIFTTRQYNHSVMSISELLNRKSKNAEEKEEEQKTDNDVIGKEVEIPKVDLSDISIDIDIPEEMLEKEKKPEEIDIDYEEEKITLPKDLQDYKEPEQEEKKETDEIDKTNALYDESMLDDEIDFSKTIDINDMLFSKADIKLDLKEERKAKSKSKKEKVQEDKDEILSVKKLNLNNITNLMFEMSSKNSRETDTVRIPNHIRTMIPEFFELDKAENREINGVNYKVKNVKFEIVDVRNNQKYVDNNAKITYKPRQSYLSFVSEKFNAVLYEEGDIARIIKISDEEYHIEIIGKDMQEYKVWSKLCNQKYRTSDKKYGIM